MNTNYNGKHSFKVWTREGWVNVETLPYYARNEAEAKGLVEHDEWCPCLNTENLPADSWVHSIPPF